MSEATGGDASGQRFLRLLPIGQKGYIPEMETRSESDRQQRLELARKAFKEFNAQCFWSWNPTAEITDDTIPLIVRGLRLHGGHKGYQIAAELCR